MKLIIGSHVSFNKDKQLLGSVIESLGYGSNTFMLYTGAPQNTKRIPIDKELTSLAHNLMKKENINIDNVIVHAPYIINLANPKNFDFNVSFLKEEIARTEALGIKQMVLHPGSHVGIGLEQGINNIIKVLNACLTEDTKVDICLETMAGKGTEIGKTFEEIKQIIDGVHCKDKVKVCLDTCHIHDAGYDLNNVNQVLSLFDNIIGIKKIGVVHINDSKNGLESHKDRHENIGLGNIGFNNLINIIYHDKLKDVPKILETPYINTDNGKYPPYRFEIDMIKKKQFNNQLVSDIISFYK